MYVDHFRSLFLDNSGQRTAVFLRAIAEQTGHSISRDQAKFDSYEQSLLKD